MRWSATRLRWVMLAGVLLLAGVVAGFFGLARYQAGKIWQRILARNGVNLRQETNGFTWSQSSKGRTVFTLHASKATPMGKNKYALHDAVLILYGREPGRDDRIAGKEFQYDQDAGVLRAMGEVHMDLQAPEPGGKAPQAGSPEALDFSDKEDTGKGTSPDPGVIHVRTSGLVYMRKLGVAATGEETEFRYGGITCVSRGAEFDSGQSVVRLLADVRMSGVEHGTTFVLTAGHAELSRTANTADITSPVLSSGERSARAGRALLHLRKDGSLQAAEANGTVEMRAGTQNVIAPQMTAVFGTEDKPERARLFTGVRMVDTSQAGPRQGSADAVDLTWDATGLLRAVQAQGTVRISGKTVEQDGTVEQTLAANRLLAAFVPGNAGNKGKAVLQQLRLNGQAQMTSTKRPATTPGKVVTSQVGGEELVTNFVMGAAGRVVAHDLTGSGHTRLEQVAADGGRQQSTGDRLEVVFAPSSARDATVGERQAVSSAVQTGHVEVVSWAVPKEGNPASAPEQTTGHADRAVYAGAARTLTLASAGETRASVQGSQGEVSAAQIVVEQTTGDAEASGGVIATNLSADGGPATHVLASRARLLRTAGLTEFFGEAGRPAQMWQGGSQVLAAEITLDQRARGLSARPAGPNDVVRAVFATAETRAEAGAKERGKRPGEELSTKGTRAVPVNNTVPDAARSAVRVSAAKMDYDDAVRQAVFTGDVRLSGVLGDISAERGVATLQPETGAAKQKGAGPANLPPQLGGALERMVLLGGVKLSQVGRTGVGQQLTYTAATDSFVLTGTPGAPPRVMGEQGSIVTGATLLFRNADSTIVVAGTEGGPRASGKTRVHTETDLKQKP